jgi:hypothetical protein
LNLNYVLLVNVLLVVPSLPLAIVIAAYLPPGPFTVGLVLVGTGWAWNARVLRVQTLSLRERDFVLAARVSGEPHWRIIFVEMLPNMGPILLTQMVGATTYAIGAQVGLEFLGLGDVGTVTWGSNLYWASNDQAPIWGRLACTLPIRGACSAHCQPSGVRFSWLCSLACAWPIWALSHFRSACICSFCTRKNNWAWRKPAVVSCPGRLSD